MNLDICQAFHQICIDPNSEDLTTFWTHYRSYKCKVLPFGLTNGPATFQHYMNETLMEYKGSSKKYPFIFGTSKQLTVTESSTTTTMPNILIFRHKDYINIVYCVVVL